MCVRSTLHEKTKFCKNVKSGSAVLAFDYGLILVYDDILCKFNLYLKGPNQFQLPYATCYAVLLMSQSRVKVKRTVLQLKKRYVECHLKESQIYRFSRLTTQNFLRRSPTMVADIFEDFEAPSKKFLATLLKPHCHTRLSKPILKILSIYRKNILGKNEI